MENREKKQRVLLINPKTEKYARAITAPLGLLSIASYLESKGFSVRLYDRTVEKASVESVFADFPADLVGVSLISFLSVYDAEAVSAFFHAKGLPVVWGGPLASELPEAVMKNDCVDAVSIGEGEATWLELARAVEAGNRDWSAIAGLALRGPDGKIKKTEERPFIDLAILPDINWRLVEVEKYFQTSYGCNKMLYLYAAKGCPFSCTFCYNKDFHRCTYRQRPMDALLREIRFLVENYGMDGVYFADELWCRNVREMHAICDSLKSLNLDFVWGGQTRIGIFGKEDFEYMYNAGCRWIFFGVESGSKEILKRMNKKIAYDKIEQTIADCKAAGIVTIASFIIGYPGETVSQARQTVDLICRLDTQMINLNFFLVLPGSDIYKQMVSEGTIAPVTDLRTLADEDPIRQLEYNYSDIPEIDIKVIRSWFMWRSFLANDLKVDGKRSSFTKKVVRDGLKSVKTGNLKEFVASTWNAGLEFVQTAWYANAYPRVKKKYGIR